MNRLTKHIVDGVKPANPYSPSEIIARQAAVITRLSLAYEALWKEYQQTRENYRAAWDYMEKLHAKARRSSKPMFEALIEAINEKP